jgi:hypothetical protein
LFKAKDSNINFTSLPFSKVKNYLILFHLSFFTVNLHSYTQNRLSKGQNDVLSFRISIQEFFWLTGWSGMAKQRHVGPGTWNPGEDEIIHIENKEKVRTNSRSITMRTGTPDLYSPPRVVMCLFVSFL